MYKEKKLSKPVPLGFHYEKVFQNIVPPYFSFWLVIGQIFAYVWSISSLKLERDREREREREISRKPKR